MKDALALHAGTAGDGQGVLPAKFAAEIFGQARQLRVKRGQLVIAEGLVSDDVYCVLKGRVQVSLLSLGGWETIFREMGVGELIGEMAAIDGAERSANVVALEDSILACISGGEFRRCLAEVPGAGYWMTQQLTARVRDLSMRAFEAATLPMGGRLIAELLRLRTDRKGDSREIAGMPTHGELAARIGTHRETVTRELRNLTECGLVRQNGRALIIPSVTRLEQRLEDMRR